MRTVLNLAAHGDASWRFGAPDYLSKELLHDTGHGTPSILSIDAVLHLERLEIEIAVLHFPFEPDLAAVSSDGSQLDSRNLAIDNHTQTDLHSGVFGGIECALLGHCSHGGPELTVLVSAKRKAAFFRRNVWRSGGVFLPFTAVASDVKLHLLQLLLLRRIRYLEWNAKCFLAAIDFVLRCSLPAD